MSNINITIKDARKVLKQVGKEMDDLQIQTMVTTFQILIEGWLDNHERKIFEGKTLREIVESYHE